MQAPEIMIPGEYPVSHKSDTYSMAITAWEMCLGKACFSEYKYTLFFSPFSLSSFLPFFPSKMCSNYKFPLTFPPSFSPFLISFPRALPPFRHDVHRMGKRPPLPEHWLPCLVELFNDMWNASPLKVFFFFELSFSFSSF